MTSTIHTLRTKVIKTSEYGGVTGYKLSNPTHGVRMISFQSFQS